MRVAQVSDTGQMAQPDVPDSGASPGQQFFKSLGLSYIEVPAKRDITIADLLTHSSGMGQVVPGIVWYVGGLSALCTYAGWAGKPILRPDTVKFMGSSQLLEECRGHVWRLGVGIWGSRHHGRSR